MSDWEKIFYSSSLTIFGGLLVFCVGQIIQKFVLEPIQELRKTISEICFRLNYYATAYPSIDRPERVPWLSPESVTTASNAFWESALRLETNASIIPCYDFFEAIGFVPKRSDIETVWRNLAFISKNTNTVVQDTNKELIRQIEEVKKLLHITPVCSD